MTNSNIQNIESQHKALNKKNVQNLSIGKQYSLKNDNIYVSNKLIFLKIITITMKNSNEQSLLNLL